MKALKYLTVALALAVPIVIAVTPAEAMRARQTALQGRGIYTNSKGVPEGYGYYQRRGPHHRNWYRHGRYR